MISFPKLVSKPTLVALALAVSQTVSPSLVLANDASVRIAGKAVFDAQGADGGSSVDQYAQTIQRNLDNALVASNDRSSAAVNVTYVKGLPVITLGGYSVVTVDDQEAKSAGTTPAELAQKWALALKQALADSASISDYVAQLSGAASSPQPAAPAATPALAYNVGNGGAYPAAYGDSQANSGAQAPYQGGQPPYRGRIVYAPAGLTLPASLRTSVSTQASRAGDLIEASLSDSVDLGGGGQIPAGSVLVGHITDSKAGGRFEKSGALSVKFVKLRTPDGAEIPIAAHIVGEIGKYKQVGGESGTIKGEGMTAKFGQAAIRGGVGAGLGAALGTAVGAIASHGFGPSLGRGAWSGTAIGGGLGVADSLILRKGRDVVIPSGTMMQVQLDAPASISVGDGGPHYTASF